MMRPLLDSLALIFVIAGVAHGAGECGGASADRVALRLAPCISDADEQLLLGRARHRAEPQMPVRRHAVRHRQGCRDQAGGRHYHPQALQHDRSPRRLQVRRYATCTCIYISKNIYTFVQFVLT